MSYCKRCNKQVKQKEVIVKKTAWWNIFCSDWVESRCPECGTLLGYIYEVNSM